MDTRRRAAGLLDDMADIRVDRATDADRFLASDKLVWFDNLVDEPTELQVRGVPADQRFAAEVVGSDVDPGTYPGVYGVRPMQLSVPDGSGTGRALPVAGLTWVGVHPDHRRQGLLTAMLRHHFEQTRREGVHVSALHASEPGIYGRHGYGLASLELQVELGRGTTFVAPHLDDEAAAITTRLHTITDDGVTERRRGVDLDLLSECVGSDRRRRRLLLDARPPHARGASATASHRGSCSRVRDGRDVGYVVLKRKHKWPNARPAAEVEVSPLSGGPAARLALARRVVDLDLAGSIKVHGVAESDPLLSWVQGPRGLGDVRPYDSLWVRLVDLPAALAARGYEAECDVVVEVTDEPPPGTPVAGGSGSRTAAADVSRTDDDADVSLPVSALGAAYLGGANLAALHRAGVVAEHRPGAARELWGAFRTDLGPYSARGF